LFNGVAAIAAGAALMFPDNKWIGAVLIAIGILMVAFDIHFEGWKLKVGGMLPLLRAWVVRIFNFPADPIKGKYFPPDDRTPGHVQFELSDGQTHHVRRMFILLTVLFGLIVVFEFGSDVAFNYLRSDRNNHQRTQSSLSIPNPIVHSVKQSPMHNQIPPTVVPRVFVTLDPIGFYKLFSGMTQIQRDKLFELYRDKWMANVTGTVVDVSHAGSFLVPITLKENPNAAVILSFDETWADKVSILQKGDQITVTGQIVGVLMLQHCELTSATETKP
jgi:hypothetical protein